MEEQKRHSGFETMRILSMVMIVLMHGIGHGGLGVLHRRGRRHSGSTGCCLFWRVYPPTVL